MVSDFGQRHTGADRDSPFVASSRSYQMLSVSVAARSRSRDAWGRGGPLRALLFAACCAVFLWLPGGGLPRSCPAAHGATGGVVALTQADLDKFRDDVIKRYNQIFAGPKKARSKKLLEYRDYEVVLYQGKRKLIPRLFVRPTPPAPVTLSSAGAVVEGDEEAIRGFPFTTGNKGSLEIGFPRISGQFGITLVDPPATMDLDEGKRGAEVSYAQSVPNIGDVTAKVDTSGEWTVHLERDVEDIGHLTGDLDSQLDWIVDLESTYDAVKGVVPTVKYGATQDGMRVEAKLEAPLGSKFGATARGSYAVRNLAGKYSPADFLHDCKVVAVAGPNDRHTLEAHGSYDRRLLHVPFRGSVGYKAKVKQATLEASADFDTFRLRCSVPPKQVAEDSKWWIPGMSVSASMGKPAEKGGQPPKEIELQIGKASAAAMLADDKPPRLRLSLGR